jgi:hypothetical protein
MSNNTVPYEVIAGAAIQLWINTADTAKPSLDDDDTDLVTATWSKVGISGDLSYDNGAGVSVEHPQNINFWRALGDSGSRKAFRADEDCIVRVKVVDLTLATYSLALNGNTVSTGPAGTGTQGYKKIGLSRGLMVNTKALLVRLMISPYGDNWSGQYYFPRVALIGSPTVQYMKTEPAGLELQFQALVKPDAASAAERFGVLEFVNANAL